MYLIDTSVWVDYFREKNNTGTAYLKKILDENLPFGITGIIYQEILQGAKTPRDLKQLIEYLSTQRFFHPKDPIVTFQAAAQLYFECRRVGMTPRSTIDCLIAQIAMEHNLVLVHHDKDYRVINKIAPKLKLI